jgi:fluoroacetyl-CoA thioesterase
MSETAGAGLRVGLVGEVDVVVSEEHTAPHVGSGQVRVLATPVMVNLIEAAALKAAEPYVPAGHQTVGTLLDVRHLAATPVGMKVRAFAEVVLVEGRRIVFKVRAEDEVEPIGEGMHERVIINLDKFDARMGAKILRRVPSVAPKAR